MKYLYLIILLFSLAGLFLADYRFKLAWFLDRRVTGITILIGVALFLVWDVLGVLLGIFFIGESRYLSGTRILPEVPVEELLFLMLLCYTSLLVYLGVGKK